jgi:hypothetical protein
MLLCGLVLLVLTGCASGHGPTTIAREGEVFARVACMGRYADRPTITDSPLSISMG